MAEQIRVVIPPETLAALRSIRFDPETVYRFRIPGRIAVAGGAELSAVADDIIHLAGALEWAGAPTILAATRRLQGFRRRRRPFVPPRRL